MNKTQVRLPLGYCVVIDFPEDSELDCGNNSLDSSKEICYTCHDKARFIFGGTLDETGTTGHVICIVLWVLTLFMGVFGIVANSFIISVLGKHNQFRPFDFLLYVLAGFDLLNSITSIVNATAFISFFENWSRGLFALISYYASFLLFLFGRSASSYITAFITIERYLVVAFPIKSSKWFTVAKTKMMTVGVVFVAILLNIPRITSLAIGYNYEGQNVKSLQDRKYVVFSTPLEEFWYTNLKSIHYQIDFYTPFILLLIFNVLLYIEILKFAKKRQGVTKKQRQEIRAARMFVPVVIVLFACNAAPVSAYAVLKATGIYYRELVLGMMLSVSVNSAANLPIYYARGSSFRKEMRQALPLWIRQMLPTPKENVMTSDTFRTTSKGKSDDDASDYTQD